MAHAEVAGRAARRAPGRAGKSPGTVVAWLTTRKAVRSGVIWGYIFGVAIASSAVSYTRIYKTPAQREALAAAYGANKATSALFGPAPQLQTVAGFTVFKISMTLMILGAVWGLLTSTRLLRGEEDNGRWELLLAGQTTRSGAAAQALGGLGAGVVTLWAVTGLITALTGLYSSVGIAAGPALYFALAMVAAAVMFLAVGALTSQLGGDPPSGRLLRRLVPRRQLRRADDRRRGSGTPRADLGVSARLGGGTPASYRAPAAGPAPDRRLHRGGGRRRRAPGRYPRRRGEHRAGPGQQPSASAAAHRARGPCRPAGPARGDQLVDGGRRLRAAVRADRQVGRRHDLGVIGAAGARQARRARDRRRCGARRVLPSPGGPDRLRGRRPDHRGTLGRGGRTARPPAGPSRLPLAVARREAPGRRRRPAGEPACWPASSAWLGAASQHAGVGFATMLEAGMNLVPPAVTILGIGTLAFGVWPRVTSIVVYVLLGWSLLAVVIGGIGAISHWILDTSVFHQMASAPAVPPHWEANGVMVAIGVASALIGGIAFNRRDLQGE